jgi:hypothetical protein
VRGFELALGSVAASVVADPAALGVEDLVDAAAPAASEWAGRCHRASQEVEGARAEPWNHQRAAVGRNRPGLPACVRAPRIRRPADSYRQGRIADRIGPAVAWRPSGSGRPVEDQGVSIRS